MYKINEAYKYWYFNIKKKVIKVDDNYLKGVKDIVKSATHFF